MRRHGYSRLLFSHFAVLSQPVAKTASIPGSQEKENRRKDRFEWLGSCQLELVSVATFLYYSFPSGALWISKMFPFWKLSCAVMIMWAVPLSAVCHDFQILVSSPGSGMISFVRSTQFKEVGIWYLPLYICN